jgi:NitT/TauT family transport system ATP-binding protein
MEIEPIPQVSSGKVLGLLEYLDDHNGREDIYKLARETHYEFGELLSVIKMAEMLGLVETPKGDVVIQDLGKKLVKSRITQRKAIVREQLRRFKLFQILIDSLEKAEDKRLDREAVLEKLSSQLPHEDSQRLFDTLVNWGRYSELLGYSHDTDKVYLDEGS